MRGAIDLELWIDGSFLTEKIDPSDVDLVAKIHVTKFWSWSDVQKDMVLWMTGKDSHQEVKDLFKCDCYGFVIYDQGHPDFESGERQKKVWGENTFGRALRSREPKGIAVLTLSDGFQLRVRSHQQNMKTNWPGTANDRRALR